jgi:hypothetical protein
MINTRPTFTEADFRKATQSEPNESCVHVARRDRWVEVRDTKTVFGSSGDGRLAFGAEQFDNLVAWTRMGIR